MHKGVHCVWPRRVVLPRHMLMLVANSQSSLPATVVSIYLDQNLCVQCRRDEVFVNYRAFALCQQLALHHSI